MFPKFDRLGEKTINKIAEVALATQFQQAEKLNVQVKTDPNNLAKGVLESLAIDGKGLVMLQNLQMEALKINLNTIAVSPLKALMGNIVLTQPSHGTARIVFNEDDLESAFKTKAFQQKISNHKIHIDGQPVEVNIKRVNVRILADGRVVVKIKIATEKTEDIHRVCLIIIPAICDGGKGVLLDNVVCTQGKDLSPAIITTLIEETRKTLNLTNFQVEGLSFKINKLNVEEGKINLHAAAGISKLPKG
jgi:hypothetical protein